jgi:hypothetical protein
MPDMSKWDADAPVPTTVWWASRAEAVPMECRAKFQDFLNALGAYNANASPANRNILCDRVKLLINALPNRTAPLPLRERLAAGLRPGQLRDKLHSSTHHMKGESDNLISGLKNLVANLGGHLVPDSYQV